MKITGTFLDEISHDIPHQNWGKKEWDRDFAAMKAMGIDTVIMIRCGHKKFITYPSAVLMKERDAYRPPVDLVEMFLSLSDQYGMDFYFGLYDSGEFWSQCQYLKELAISRHVAEEAWEKYGHHKSFKGWYLNWEVSRRKGNVAELYHEQGKFVKNLSDGLKTMISPFIGGVKIYPDNPTTLEEHEREWDGILGTIAGAVDIVAFQDGHCTYDELADYLILNSKLARRHGLTCWTNCESFDRDMPWNFPPIKWEKMLLKLEAARKAEVDKAITFEFSHFMSPYSMFPSARGVYDRYMEHFQR